MFCHPSYREVPRISTGITRLGDIGRRRGNDEWTRVDLLRALTVLLTVILTLFGLGSAEAKIVVPGNVAIDADDGTVTGVLAMFERAEQAVKAHDLETLLSFYSSEYNYHGLKKDDVRKIWKDLFDEY